MRGMYVVSESEWEVLKMLWKCGKDIKQSELLALFEKEGKEWKRQTLNTFLHRLEEKGLVKREQRIVRAVYSEEEYRVMQMRESIDTLYGGRVSSFLASFMKTNGIQEDEREVMRRLLDQVDEQRKS